MAVSAGSTIVELLRCSRFDVLPLDGIEDEVREHLATDVTVTVAASPSKGLEATLELSERLAAAGYPVVPHLSARLVRDRAHLEEVLARLQAAGVRELFVPAGDATEPGEFHDAADLLAAMGAARARFDRIGITGYPESHPLISDEETIRAMFAKAEMATDIISQLCFDADTIDSWIRNVRERGTRLPIWIGMPGCVDQAKLVRVTMKIGPARPPHAGRDGSGRGRGRLPPLHVQRGGQDRALAPADTEPAQRSVIYNAPRGHGP